MPSEKILLITHKEDLHADCIISELRSRQADFFRFNTDEYPRRVECKISLSSDGRISSSIRNETKSISSDETKSVIYLPELQGRFDLSDFSSVPIKEFVAKESIVMLSLLFESFAGAFWVNTVNQILAAKNKLRQMRIAAELGFVIPRTFFCNTPEAAGRFIDDNLPTATALKTQTGIWRMTEENIISAGAPTRKVEKAELTRHSIPMFLQEYIEKKFELRVTVVGTQVFACEIHNQESPNEATRIDWRVHDFKHVSYLPHQLPSEVEERCISLLQKLNLHYGAIDLILTPTGQYIFLEINPDGLWQWIERLTELPIAAAISDLLINPPSQPISSLLFL